MPFAVLQELIDLFPNVDPTLNFPGRIKGDIHSFKDSAVVTDQGIQKEERIKIFLISSSNDSDRIRGKTSAELQESTKDNQGSDLFWSLIRNP